MFPGDFCIRASFKKLHGSAPIGKQVISKDVSIEVIQDGKIIKRQVNGDWASIALQLGLNSQALAAE